MAVTDRGQKGSARAAYFTWTEEVEKAKGKTDVVVSLYAEDAILLPTLSPKICTDKEMIKEYFINFLSLEGLKSKTQELISRNHGEIAMNTGLYDFTYLKNGKEETVQARFDFWYRKEGDNWKIIFHQSSILPSSH